MCVASEATHGAVGAKQSRFFWVVVHQRLQRRANGLVLQGPASAMLFVPLLLYNISCLQTAGSRKWRRFGQEDKQAFLHRSHTLTHPPQTEAADWARSLAVCGCFSPFSRPSPAAPTVGGRTPTTKRAPRRCLPAGGLAGDDSERRFAGFALFALTLSVAGLRGGREAPRRLLSPPAVRPHSPDRLDGNQCRLYGHLTSESEARCVQQRHIRPSLSQ